MARVRKYLSLTDTDIDNVIDSFEHIIEVADSTQFQSYINTYHLADIEYRGYDSTQLIQFCTHIHEFISKKREKLRVKSDLKLNKDQLFGLIFTDCDFDITPDLKFQVFVLFEYCFSKHEIYDHLDNMEDNYKSMYEKYLSDYDMNNT